MTDSNILRQAIERLLEDVSLTADLIDDAAKLLLDWGITQTKAVVQQEDRLSTDELGTRLADLRHTLKRVSKEAGQTAPEDQAAQVQTLLSEITPETWAAQTPDSLSETLPEKEEPEVDEWCANSKSQSPLS